MKQIKMCDRILKPTIPIGRRSVVCRDKFQVIYMQNFENSAKNSRNYRSSKVYQQPTHLEF